MGAIFELLGVALFDLLHEGLALEKIRAELRRELAGNREKLIVEYLRKRDRSTCRNQMGTPLEHKPDIPKNEKSERYTREGQSGFARAKKLCETIEKNGEPKNEECSERDKEAVAVRGDTVPIRVASDEQVKDQESGKHRCANSWHETPEEK